MAISMIDYAPQRRLRQRPPARKRFLVLIFIFFLIWGIYGSVRTLFFRDRDISEISLSQKSRSVTQGNSLANVIEKVLPVKNAEYGIVVKNLKTDETYLRNEHQKFDSASLYKLWVMGSVFEQINAGKLSEEQKLEEEVSVLNEKFHIASESAELTEGTVEFTVGDALEKMITISDNYAALLLTAKIRLSTVASYLDTHGLRESRVSRGDENPVTTASDISLFYEKLYRNQLAEIEYTEKMLALLRGQRLNEKLPKDLPEDVVIAHKTGELGTISHDAGIVYSPQGDYIIVVLSDTKEPLEANAKISVLSRAVYDFFSK
ncbi:MAG: beta-lactamase [Candidatus Parcubacteria bacterium]